MKLELLAPAGDMNKLKTAFYYGADAVYIGGKAFSLRAFADNFTNEEILEAVKIKNSLGRKLYVTVNILARDTDFEKAEEYLKFLEKAGVDGVIVSDVGLISLARRVAPNLPVNVSTQANVLNSETVRFWRYLGVKRIILARELSIKEIERIHFNVPDIELESFIHGAMCISYSGRCLLSEYLSGRDGNRGACVQSCRWEYEIREKSRGGEYLTVQEDERGTYLLNSKDLNLIDRIHELASAGVISFKIEGRMKSEYYLATVINAYRRAIDSYYEIGESYKENTLYRLELEKTAHRLFTEAYALGDNPHTVNHENSQSKGTRKFIALVVEGNQDKEYAVVEMRNRFVKGDILEVLSPTESFNKTITVGKMLNEKGEEIDDAKRVQEKIKLFTTVKLNAGDMLRIESKE